MKIPWMDGFCNKLFIIPFFPFSFTIFINSITFSILAFDIDQNAGSTSLHWLLHVMTEQDSQTRQHLTNLNKPIGLTHKIVLYII